MTKRAITASIKIRKYKEPKTKPMIAMLLESEFNPIMPNAMAAMANMNESLPMKSTPSKLSTPKTKASLPYMRSTWSFFASALLAELLTEIGFELVSLTTEIVFCHTAVGFFATFRFAILSLINAMSGWISTVFTNTEGDDAISSLIGVSDCFCRVDFFER